VDAGGTRLRLRALHVMGHSFVRLAHATGISERAIRAIISDDAKTVSTRLRDAIITVYDKWWDKRAPEHTPSQRAAATPPISASTTACEAHSLTVTTRALGNAGRSALLYRLAHSRLPVLAA
jgi:hypothetical protein